MSETPELTVLALTAIQRETFVVLWLFKMCTKVCFFPSVALARSYQDFNELSAKKNMLAQLQTRELNFNFVCYLSFKKVFLPLLWDYHWGLSPRLFVGCQVDLEDPDRFDGSLFFHRRSIVCGPTNNLCVWKSERKLNAFTQQFCAYAPKGNE